MRELVRKHAADLEDTGLRASQSHDTPRFLAYRYMALALERLDSRLEDDAALLDRIKVKLEQTPEPPPRGYVTVYPFRWGIGLSPEDSKANARKAGGRGKNWATFRLPVGVEVDAAKGLPVAYVDGMGSVRWTFREGFTPYPDDPHPELERVACGADWSEA